MFNSHFFVNKFSYLVLLIPLFLITGPFLPDFALSVTCILFLLLTIKEKNYKKFNNKFVKFFLLFWLTLVISSLLSENLVSSLKSSFFYFRFGLFVIILNFLFKENKSFEKNFIKIGFLSILIVLISCLIEFLLIRYDYIKEIYSIFISTDALNFKVQSTNLINTIDNRVSGIFGSEGVAGSYILRLSPFFFIFYLTNIYRSEKKPSVKKIFFFNLIFVLISLTILFSGERAAFFLFCFSIILHFLIIKRLREYLKYSLYSSLILIIVFINFDPVVGARIISQTKYQLTHFHDLTKKEIKNDSLKSDKLFIISETHQGHMVAAWKIFKENKFFGAGSKGYRYECYNTEKFVKDKNISCSTHPHNTLMQFLSETGILGTLFYLILLFIILFEVIKKIFQVNFKKNLKTSVDFDVRNCGLICILINIWPLTTSGSFFNNWLSIVYFLPVIFYLKNNKFLEDA